MTLENSQKKYIEINKTFKSKLVFRLGAEAGFFSEYNNMIFAMLYCLQNQIQFSLYSKDANFCYENGWTDYFNSLWNEESNPLHSKYNNRRPFTYKRENGNKYVSLFYNKCVGPIMKRRNEIKERLIKYRYFDVTNPFYFTHELWDHFHSKSFESINFSIPDLLIEGDIRQACRNLMDMTWQYNLNVEQEIVHLKGMIHLPLNYIGLHIRGGDKFIEYELHETKTYIEKAESISSCRAAFVLTDDYKIIEELSLCYPNWSFSTLCEKNERGYNHMDFTKQDKKSRKRQIIRLLASTDILREADFFVGTYNSNVGAYIGIRMNREKCFGVDFENWRIF